MRSGVRADAVIVAMLFALLMTGAALAWTAAARPAAGSAPLHAARAVPAAGAGSPTVELSADAHTHPASAPVRDQLQRYFDAINARQYGAWTATVAQQRVAEQPEPAWLAGVDTTVDGTIRIDRIDDLEGARVLAHVRFVSTQDVSDAPAAMPAGRICWRASLPMAGSPLLLESGRLDSLVAESC